mmetsp:Transcript_17446/g.24524  ORF Transcript_17446/g.24524 Transcript_17446/m.24524 type:complete len:230 (+) Transcript_17446:424-1113(+)
MMYPRNLRAWRFLRQVPRTMLFQEVVRQCLPLVLLPFKRWVSLGLIHSQHRSAEVILLLTVHLPIQMEHLLPMRRGRYMQHLGVDQSSHLVFHHRSMVQDRHKHLVATIPVLARTHQSLDLDLRLLRSNLVLWNVIYRVGLLLLRLSSRRNKGHRCIRDLLPCRHQLQPIDLPIPHNKSLQQVRQLHPIIQVHLVNHSLVLVLAPLQKLDLRVLLVLLLLRLPLHQEGL